ncbi:hypothetical protein [Streptomyces sp. NPDC050485]|uniref:hypothetical protein n=1 Tax=Streptomyces sp. NPDC050485 TaxID=3365617 RepID=UPI0037A78786
MRGPAPTVDHNAAIEAIKQRLPSVQQLLADWPAGLPQLPAATYATADLCETRGFDDPRLVLYTGITRGPSVTVGWCLFGASRNVQPGHSTLPHAAREALTDPNAARALQLLAVDHLETEEAAIEALAAPGAVRPLVGLAAAAHQEHEGRSEPLRVEVGTTIYAYPPGPVHLGTAIADIVCIGSPIWIGQ